jgi:hypothetical protein
MPSPVKSALCCSLFAGCLLAALPAAAHSPPMATGIFVSEAPHAPAMEWVRTNRGVILKAGAGQPLRLLCNDAYGASLSEVVPMLAAGDGLVIATYSGGLVRLAPDGCNAPAVEAPLASRHVADLAADSEANRFFALLSPSDSGPGGVLVSADAGLTWSAGAEIPDFGTALLVAPSDSARVYVSAIAETADGTASNQLYVSSDAAQTFSPQPFTLSDSEVRAFVVAVDPADADRVFLRTVAANPEMPDRLLLSEDAGHTFSEVYSALGPLVLAISADTVWLGGKTGLFRSDDRGKHFEAVPGAPSYVSCLRVAPEGLSLCGYQNLEFGVFRAADGQAPFSSELRFTDVTELACGAQTEQACQANFADFLDDVAPANDGTGSGGTNGAGGSHASGGNGSGVAGDAPARAGSGTAQPSAHSSGCSFGATPGEATLPLALLLSVACAAARRRKLRTGSAV